MSYTSSVLLFLLMCTLHPEMECIGTANSSAPQHLRVEVVEVLFIHSYCAHEHFDSQNVFNEVKKTVFQLNSSLSTLSPNAGWIINLNEGDVKVWPFLTQSCLCTILDTFMIIS